MGQPLLNHLKTQTKNNLDFHRILELRLYSFFAARLLELTQKAGPISCYYDLLVAALL